MKPEPSGTPRIPVAIALAIACIALPDTALSQDRTTETSETPPRIYTQALQDLTAGDTASAIERLRQATEAAPDFGPAHLRLGAILRARATEIETDFEDRREAERLLERAWELMGNDPEVLLEYGLLRLKQRRRLDAKRLLDRAWEAAQRAGRELSPQESARFHYTLGRIYETWWEDWQDLVMLPDPERTHMTCANLEAPICGSPSVAQAWFAVYCPHKWWDQTSRLPALADLKSEERARMVEHLRRAYQADTSLVDAGVRLLGHLADAGNWHEYLRIAERLTSTAPSKPRPYLFLGLGLHHLGREDAAGEAFDRALALLPPEQRGVFEDVSLLIPHDVAAHYARLDSGGRAEAADLIFTAKDPLFLTDRSERRLEHYARLAWAELKFADPGVGLRGWDSERGRIWVRYGAPQKRIQCCYGARAVRQGTPAGRMRCLRARPPAKPPVRYITWSYGEGGPNFSFQRRLTHRKARLTEPAAVAAENLQQSVPEFYRPRMITTVHALPHQLVRFRGSRPELTRVEVYAQPPRDSLYVFEGDAVQAGIFVFDADYDPVWQHRDTAIVGAPPLGLSYTYQLPPGAYRYGLEARRAGPDTLARPLARERGELEATGYPRGELALSDVLLANAIRPLTERPTRREDLRIWPSRTLRFAPDAPIGLYFEIYGLTEDPDGLAHYRLTVRVEAVDDGQNVLAKLVGTLGGLLGGGDEAPPELTYERAVVLAGDRVPEYLLLDLATADPGGYRVRLTIEDIWSGGMVAITRGFETVEP